ncbi:MAG: hypothetical protein Q9165_006640 [Trypethelium subeluteriae]
MNCLRNADDKRFKRRNPPEESVLLAVSPAPGLEGYDARSATTYKDYPRDTMNDQLDIESLSNVFFQKVNPVFDILDQSVFNKRLQDAWSLVDSDSSYVVVVCGVAALGSLFSAGHPQESALVDHARIHLEQSSTAELPSVDHLAGWLLRVLFLRCTAAPYTSWLAICTTMHVAQATRLFRESKWPPELFQATFEEQDTCRRQLWTAIILASWISFEYGLTGPCVPDPKPRIPTTGSANFQQLIQIYQCSRLLEPEAAKDSNDLDATIQIVIDFVPLHNELALDRSFLLLCLLRRLRILNNSLPDSRANEILEAARTGLHACRVLALENQPWWHVASLPFQYLCSLLAIDTRNSLLRVGGALETINLVAAKFPSREMRRTTQLSRILVDAFRRRKEEDSSVLTSGLAKIDQPSQDSDISAPYDNNLSLDTSLLHPNFDWESFDWDGLLGSFQENF